jgi:tRNA pseudouridine38-40 synthase
VASKADNTAPPPGRRRFALLLEYDGTVYAGSQLQANAETVQGALEEAVRQTTDEEVRVAFAGRTDAGVHARGQVASFATAARLDEASLLRALNARLPQDIAVRQIREVDLSFDPRRDATSRWYRYLIDSHPVRSPLRRLQGWHVPVALDETQMAEASAGMVGHRDFAAFASRFEDQEASTVRDLRRFDVRRAGSSVICDLEANAFLPHQVRRMVGALVEVGKGRMSAEQYVSLLEAAPASVGPAAPPHGLYLMRVCYEPEVFLGLDSEQSLC